MTEADLGEVLRLHKMWLNSEPGGVRADLSRADLSGADLSGAVLRGADLGEAVLRGADLSEADLSRAVLSRADLSGAVLSRADLSGAGLSGAVLRGADLGEADLSGADLGRADLSRAEGCTEIPVGDPRGYRCVSVRFGENWMVYAGCRGPFSIEDAEKHWGSAYIGEREIGDRYLHGLKWLRDRLAQESNGETL